MIVKTYYLHCTQCGKEFKENDDSITFIRGLAKENGWEYKKVPNGSFWDFCPRCIEYNKNR